MRDRASNLLIARDETLDRLVSRLALILKKPYLGPLNGVKDLELPPWFWLVGPKLYTVLIRVPYYL